MQRIRDIAQGAKDFADIANQLGLINDETSEAIGNVADLGAGIARIAAGDIAGGILQGLSGLGGVLGIGESAEEKEANRLRKANNEQLARLTREIGNVDFGITGSTFASLEKAFAIITDPSKFLLKDNTRAALGPGGGLGTRVTGVLESFGLTMDDVRAAAEAMGLEFENSASFYRAFAKGLQEIELTRFAETFSGQLDLLNRSFDVLGIEDPAEQFRKTIDLLTSDVFGSPAIQQALAGIDLSTTEGIEQAREALRNVFKNFESLTPEDLGGLTPEQFLDALAQATGLATESLEKLVGTTDEAVASMTNIPRGFKAAAAEWAATLPEVTAKPFAGEMANAVRGLDGIELRADAAFVAELDALADRLGQQQLSAVDAFKPLEDSIGRFAERLPVGLGDAVTRLGTLTPPDLLDAVGQLARSTPSDLLDALAQVRDAVLLTRQTTPVSAPPATSRAPVPPVVINIHATEGQTAAQVAEAAAVAFRRLAMRHTGDTLDYVGA